MCVWVCILALSISYCLCCLHSVSFELNAAWCSYTPHTIFRNVYDINALNYYFIWESKVIKHIKMQCWVLECVQNAPDTRTCTWGAQIVHFVFGCVCEHVLPAYSRINSHSNGLKRTHDVKSASVEHPKVANKNSNIKYKQS